MRRFEFMANWRYWFAVSGVVLIVALAALFTSGLRYGIEFTGGTLMEVRTPKVVSVSQVRDAISSVDAERGRGAVIQPAANRSVFIRTSELTPDEQAEITQVLKQKVGAERRSIESVGAEWGRQITQAAVLALVLSILALLIYISLRFEFKMAVCAIVALAHDILISIGIYALVGREVTPATVAALLTILGYSLYDTIVVFHRILENSSKLVRMTYSQMANESVNQVLVRSINTTVVTLLPVAAILFLGGETLKDFAFALFVGIGSGAYSSIFTASPLLALWKEREPKYTAIRRRVQKAATSST